MVSTAEAARGGSPRRFRIVGASAQIPIRNRQALRSEKGQLVEIAALEHDLALAHPKEAAAAQPIRIAPFQNGPVALLEQVLDQTVHLRATEFDLEHPPDRRPADQRVHHHLMIDRVVGIQRGESVDVARVEVGDPDLNQLAG